MHKSALFLILLVAGCDPENAERDLLASNLDRSVSPGTDFFQYANGGWIGRNPIPASESSWTIGHHVDNEIYAIKKKLNEDAAQANAPAGSDQRKIGDFWTAAMDPAKASIDGIAPALATIDSIRTVADVPRVAAALQRLGVSVLWSFTVGQDQKDSERIAVMISQGGLGLPDRDYYFKDEAGVAATRAEYPKHIGRMLALLGRPDRGDAVVAFETALAKASRALEALNDPYANYNKTNVDQLSPLVGWRGILDGYGLAAAKDVIVGQPEFLAALDAALQATPIDDLKDYLRFHLASAYAFGLGSAFDLEHFAFYGRTLQGSTEQRPLWKRVLDAEERAMGMVVGRLFVQSYFPEATKRRYLGIVEAVRATYREHIAALPWMSDATKAKALEKLDKMSAKVGFPDRWKDYSALEVAPDSYVGNMMRAATWAFDDAVHKFGKPVDRTEWEMTPQSYNAYYNPSNNEIVLPAAVFIIPGLADADADDALVYGYCGAATIGHEITHGFDDYGRQYDANGNLSDWWTQEDAAQFKLRADVMVAQFDAYEPIPGIHVNGRATLGENIADLGGVVLGLDAFKKTAQFAKNEPIGGLTPVQRFFLGYALGWMGHERPETLRSRLLSDVHSPTKWRVNGPFANVPDFFTAFGIKEGDAMWRAPEVRVKIW